MDEIYLTLYDLSLMPEDSIRQYFNERIILATRNNDVDAINHALLQRLPGDSNTYASADSAFNDAAIADVVIPNDYLITIVAPRMALHETTSKVNCPIILHRDFNPHEGLCNGTLE